MPRMTLDRMDRRILEHLQADGRLSNQALAGRVKETTALPLERLA